MSVDLSELIGDLQSEVSPPGKNMFPAATDDEWLSNLRNAFWQARLEGMLAGYQEADGSITPIAPATIDLSRDFQQLIIVYAGMRIIRNTLRTLQTSFHAETNGTIYEVEQSAQVFKGLLDDLKSEKDLILLRLSDVGKVPSYYIDAIMARDESIKFDETHWVR
jgi:hypothetical protein